MRTMIAPGNEMVILTLALAFLLSSAYAFGRIHQWHKRGLERDEAYRTGYDNASRSIISMMTDRESVGSGRHVGYPSEREENTAA